MRRLEDNIKMYLKEIVFEDVDSILLVQGNVFFWFHNGRGVFSLPKRLSAFEEAIKIIC
jgi:hypothetical protein